MVQNFAAGGEPHALVVQDMAERRVQAIDPVSDPDKKGVDRDRQDAARPFTLAIENVELASELRVDCSGVSPQRMNAPKSLASLEYGTETNRRPSTSIK